MLPHPFSRLYKNFYTFLMISLCLSSSISEATPYLINSINIATSNISTAFTSLSSAISQSITAIENINPSRLLYLFWPYTTMDRVENFSVPGIEIIVTYPEYPEGVYPGETVFVTVRIKNTADETLYLTPAGPGGFSVRAFGLRKEEPRYAFVQKIENGTTVIDPETGFPVGVFMEYDDWVLLDSSDPAKYYFTTSVTVSLAPGENQTVSFTFKVPHDMPTGSWDVFVDGWYKHGAAGTVKVFSLSVTIPVVTPYMALKKRIAASHDALSDLKRVVDMWNLTYDTSIAKYYGLNLSYYQAWVLNANATIKDVDEYAESISEYVNPSELPDPSTYNEYLDLVLEIKNTADLYTPYLMEIFTLEPRVRAVRDSSQLIAAYLSVLSPENQERYDTYNGYLAENATRLYQPPEHYLTSSEIAEIMDNLDAIDAVFDSIILAIPLSVSVISDSVVYDLRVNNNVSVLVYVSDPINGTRYLTARVSVVLLDSDMNVILQGIASVNPAKEGYILNLTLPLSLRSGTYTLSATAQIDVRRGSSSTDIFIIGIPKLALSVRTDSLYYTEGENITISYVTVNEETSEEIPADNITLIITDLANNIKYSIFIDSPPSSGTHTINSTILGAGTYIVRGEAKIATQTISATATIVVKPRILPPARAVIILETPPIILPGSLVNVTGTIYDVNFNPLPNTTAQMTFSGPLGETTFTVRSDSEGQFRVSVTLPQAGRYIFEILDASAQVTVVENAILMVGLSQRSVGAIINDLRPLFTPRPLNLTEFSLVYYPSGEVPPDIQSATIYDSMLFEVLSDALDNRFYLNDPARPDLIVSGILKNRTHAPIANATVTVSLGDYATVSIRTDLNGFFAVAFTPPFDAEAFTVRVSYKSLNLYGVVDTYGRVIPPWYILTLPPVSAQLVMVNISKSMLLPDESFSIYGEGRVLTLMFDGICYNVTGNWQIILYYQDIFMGLASAGEFTDLIYNVTDLESPFLGYVSIPLPYLNKSYEGVSEIGDWRFEIHISVTVKVGVVWNQTLTPVPEGFEIGSYSGSIGEGAFTIMGDPLVISLTSNRTAIRPGELFSLEGSVRTQYRAEPLAYSPVTIMIRDSATLTTILRDDVVTDESGSFRWSRIMGALPSGRYIVTASVTRYGITYRASLTLIMMESNPPAIVYVTTDKLFYLTNETVMIYGNVLDASGDPVANATVHINVTNVQNQLSIYDMISGPEGNFSVYYIGAWMGAHYVNVIAEKLGSVGVGSTVFFLKALAPITQPKLVIYPYNYSSPTPPVYEENSVIVISGFFLNTSATDPAYSKIPNATIELYLIEPLTGRRIPISTMTDNEGYFSTIVLNGTETPIQYGAWMVEAYGESETLSDTASTVFYVKPPERNQYTLNMTCTVSPDQYVVGSPNGENITISLFGQVAFMDGSPASGVHFLITLINEIGETFIISTEELSDVSGEYNITFTRLLTPGYYMVNLTGWKIVSDTEEILYTGLCVSSFSVIYQNLSMINVGIVFTEYPCINTICPLHHALGLMNSRHDLFPGPFINVSILNPYQLLTQNLDDYDVIILQIGWLESSISRRRWITENDYYGWLENETIQERLRAYVSNGGGLILPHPSHFRSFGTFDIAEILNIDEPQYSLVGRRWLYRNWWDWVLWRWCSYIEVVGGTDLAELIGVGARTRGTPAFEIIHIGEAWDVVAQAVRLRGGVRRDVMAIAQYGLGRIVYAPIIGFGTERNYLLQRILHRSILWASRTPFREYPLSILVDGDISEWEAVPDNINIVRGASMIDQIKYRYEGGYLFLLIDFKPWVRINALYQRIILYSADGNYRIIIGMPYYHAGSCSYLLIQRRVGGRWRRLRWVYGELIRAHDSNDNAYELAIPILTMASFHPVIDFKGISWNLHVRYSSWAWRRYCYWTLWRRGWRFFWIMRCRWIRVWRTMIYGYAMEAI